MKKKILSNFVLSGLSLLFTFSVLEIFIRKLLPQSKTNVINEVNAKVGWLHPIDGLFWEASPGEFNVQSQSNSEGFFDEDHMEKKPPHTFRILVLGDSYVEAAQVKRKESIAYLLEKVLNEPVSSIKFEVLNMGMRSFGTDQEFLTYHYFGKKYKPDVVLLLFNADNDIIDNSMDLDMKVTGRRETIKPYFYLENEELKMTDFVPSKVLKTKRKKNQNQLSKKNILSVKKFLREHSQFYLFVREGIRSHPKVHRLLQSVAVMAKYKRSGEEKPIYYGNQRPVLYTNGVPLYYNIYLEQYDDAYENAWRLTKAILLRFKKEVEDTGSYFILVSLPGRQAVYPDWWKEILSTYPKMVDYPFDLSKPERILENFCAQHEIVYLSLLPRFREHFKMTDQRLYYKYDGHWNRKGHRVAAESIYQFLIENHLIPLKDQPLAG